MNTKKTKQIDGEKFTVAMIGTLLLLLTLHMTSFSTPLQAQENGKNQDKDKIVETVYVENIMIPVRVFDGKKPVQGLNKADFQLFVNGKENAINAFYEVRKKLEDKRSAPADTAGKTPEQPRPRLFVLIFNLSDYGMDLASKLDMFFERIVRPGDHLIAITNRFFFPEWEVTAPEKTKSKILDILAKEEDQLKIEMMRITNELRSIAARLKSRLEDPLEQKMEDFPTHIFKDFFMYYQFVLDDLKGQYLSLPVGQYIKVAEYLKGQQTDKWVLNFYQLGRLPLLDKMGQIQREIDRYTSQAESSPKEEAKVSTGYSVDKKKARQNVHRLYFDFIMQIQQSDDLLLKDISKAFLNSGATFHTLLLKPIRPEFSDDYKFENIATESEIVLKKLARLTGGTIVRSNKMEDFIKDITVNEDIIYMLSYVPDPQKKEKQFLEIKLTKNKNFRLVYDDQKRLKSFEQVMKRLTSDIEDLEIDSISLQGDRLTVKLKNMAMVRYEDEMFGAVQARIKVMNNRDKQSKPIAGFEKTYKGIKKDGIFQAELPRLSPGKYKVVLEVKDLFSMKNVYVGDAVTITYK